MDFLSALIEIWGTEDKPGAKFKVGDVVEIMVVTPNFRKYKGHKGKVVAINSVGEEDDFEYIVEGYPVLIWEERLGEVE